MPALPGSEEAAVAKLYEVLRELRDRVDRWDRAVTTTMQEATVSAALVGSTIKITTDGGAVRFVRPLVGFTAVVGHRVVVLDGPWGGIAIGEPHA